MLQVQRWLESQQSSQYRKKCIKTIIDELKEALNIKKCLYQKFCCEEMKKFYSDAINFLMIEEQIQPTITKDLRAINKISRQWDQLNYLEIISYGKISAESGILGIIIEFWCLYMKENLIRINNQNKKKNRLLVIDDEYFGQVYSPIQFLNWQIHVFVGIMKKMIQIMNYRFIHCYKKSFLKKISDSQKLLNTIQQSQKSLNKHLKNILTANPNFQLVYSQFFRCLSIKDANFLKCEEQLPESPNFLNFLQQNYKIETPLIKGNIKKTFEKSQRKIMKFHAQKSIQKKMQILSQCRIVIEDDLRLIGKKKNDEPLIDTIYFQLLKEFKISIWKSIIYVLVLYTSQPNQILHLTIQGIIQRQGLSSFIISQFSSLMRATTLMLSQTKNI